MEGVVKGRGVANLGVQGVVNGYWPGWGRKGGEGVGRGV